MVCVCVSAYLYTVHSVCMAVRLHSQSLFIFIGFICRESLSPTLRIRIDFGGIAYTYIYDGSKSDYSLLLPLLLYMNVFRLALIFSFSHFIPSPFHSYSYSLALNSLSLSSFFFCLPLFSSIALLLLLPKYYHRVYRELLSWMDVVVVVCAL